MQREAGHGFQNRSPRGKKKKPLWKSNVGIRPFKARKRSIQVDGKAVEVPIKEGEMFLLPAKVPHSPIRPENSIGLVIERKRKAHHKDGLMWFSDKENALLYEEYFHLTNIEKDFIPVFKKFYNDEKLRTCPVSGEVMEADPRFT